MVAMAPPHRSWIGWVIAASVLGFATSAMFVGRLKLLRNRFLIPYVFLVTVFPYSFIVLNELDIAELLRENRVRVLLAGE